MLNILRSVLISPDVIYIYIYKRKKKDVTCYRQIYGKHFGEDLIRRPVGRGRVKARYLRRSIFLTNTTPAFVSVVRRGAKVLAQRGGPKCPSSNFCF